MCGAGVLPPKQPFSPEGTGPYSFEISYNSKEIFSAHFEVGIPDPQRTDPDVHRNAHPVPHELLERT